MRKVLVVLLLAGVLVLALSVPALAGPSYPPSLMGQMHKIGNWAEGVPPGHRQVDVFSGLSGNPGEVTSAVVHLIQVGLVIDPDTGLPHENYGKFINGAKASTWPTS